MSSALRPITAALLAAALGLGSWSARAQDDKTKDAILRLYNEGRDLLDAGKVAEACAKLEEGRALDATALNLRLDLGDCYEKLGKTASAYNEYLEAAAIAKAKGDPREQVAREKADALLPVLARLRVEVDAEAAALPGFQLKVNGIPIAARGWGVDAPIDLGDATLEATAAGRKKWTRTLKMEPKAKRVAFVPVLELDESAPVMGARTVPCPTIAPAPTEGRTALGPIRIGAIALGGAGLVAAGMASGLALGATSKNQASSQYCTGDACLPLGIQLRNDAISRGNAATGLFIGGAAAIAAGVTLWILAPSSAPRPTVGFVPAGNGIAARGAF